jgi:hypothetical protein
MYLPNNKRLLMNTIVSIEFEHGNKTYYALVREKPRPDSHQYEITVMNSRLQHQLYGYCMIIEDNGILQYQEEAGDLQTVSLQRSILEALCKRLVSDGYLIGKHKKQFYLSEQ